MIKFVGKSIYLEDYIMERHIYDEKDGLWYMKNRTIITRPVFENGDVCDTLKSIIECFMSICRHLAG